MWLDWEIRGDAHVDKACATGRAVALAQVMNRRAPPTVLIASRDPAASERLMVKAAGAGIRALRMSEFGGAALKEALGGIDACVIDLAFDAGAGLGLAEAVRKAGPRPPPVIFVGYGFLRTQDERWRAEALGRIPAGDDFTTAMPRLSRRR